MTHENRDYIQVMRSKGYRVTSQRLIVLDAVCELKGQGTIAEIKGKVNDMDPTIDRSTIYRALDVLAEVGLIVVLDTSKAGKIYRVASETGHHLICRSCGTVLTISSDFLSPALQRIQCEYRFQVRTNHLVLNGLCQKCLEQA